MLFLEFSELAKKDFKQIARYSKLEWGKQQALAYKTMLNNKFSLIRNNPYIGHRKDGIDDTILCVSAKRHLIFYRVKENTISIIRILHDSMDYTQQL